jgi:hypothetical protein
MWSQIRRDAWYVIIGLGSFVLWLLIRVVSDTLGFYWQDKPYMDQTNAEKRGRERIMESFDRKHRDE